MFDEWYSAMCEEIPKVHKNPATLSAFKDALGYAEYVFSNIEIDMLKTESAFFVRVWRPALIRCVSAWQDPVYGVARLARAVEYWYYDEGRSCKTPSSIGTCIERVVNLAFRQLPTLEGPRFLSQLTDLVN